MSGKLYRKMNGFTLIELLVVLAIIASLLTIAFPRYWRSVDHSKESALRQDLSIMRDTLDKYYGDTGRYPDTLEQLVEKRYLRVIPPDPITGTSSSWVVIPPNDPNKGGIFDIRSGASGKSSDGSLYSSW